MANDIDPRQGMALGNRLNKIVQSDGKETGHGTSKRMPRRNDAVNLVRLNKGDDVGEDVANQPIGGPGKSLVDISVSPGPVLTNTINQGLVKTLFRTTQQQEEA